MLYAKRASYASNNVSIMLYRLPIEFYGHCSHWKYKIYEKLHEFKQSGFFLGGLLSFGNIFYTPQKKIVKKHQHSIKQIITKCNFDFPNGFCIPMLQYCTELAFDAFEHYASCLFLTIYRVDVVHLTLYNLTIEGRWNKFFDVDTIVEFITSNLENLQVNSVSVNYLFMLKYTTFAITQKKFFKFVTV